MKNSDLINKDGRDNDKIIELSTVPQMHPDHKYTSKPINTQEIAAVLQSLEITQEIKPSEKIGSVDIPY
ncbi:2274_t:CDS:1, partial [Racocetra fulgida]